MPDEDTSIAADLQQLLLDPELPFDFTLTFCEHAADRRARGPGGAGQRGATAPRCGPGMVVPVQVIPGLIAALQENFRLYQESYGPTKGTLH